MLPAVGRDYGADVATVRDRAGYSPYRFPSARRTELLLLVPTRRVRTRSSGRGQAPPAGSSRGSDDRRYFSQHDPLGVAQQSGPAAGASLVAQHEPAPGQQQLPVEQQLAAFVNFTVSSARLVRSQHDP